MGRPKGSKNVKTTIFEAELIAKELGINPFEVLLRFAAGDWKGLGYENEVYHSEKPDGSVKMGYVISPDLRSTAAAQACKYLFSAKQALDIKAPEGIKIVIEDFSKRPDTKEEG